MSHGTESYMACMDEKEAKPVSHGTESYMACMDEKEAKPVSHGTESYMELNCIEEPGIMNDKITYHHELYLSDDISEAKLDKIKKKLEDKPLLSKLYLITVSRNPGDQLEILPAKQLVFHYYSEYPVYVIGIASDYNRAVALVEGMVQECLQARGDCALKEYFIC